MVSIPKEGEDGYLKCMPFIPRQGKKFLFILVVINVVVIWFIYKRSINFSYFDLPKSRGTSKPLYAAVRNIPVFHIPLLSVKDMAPFYVEASSNVWCFKHGTELKKSKLHKKCVCSDQWYGLDCGIPAAIWKSSFLKEGMNSGVEIRRRQKPRRMIISFVIENEYDLLDINIQNSFSVVDLFLSVSEKHHYSFLLNKLQQGFLADLQNKFMPFQLNTSVSYNNIEEWTSSMLTALWTSVWRKITDFRPDDIFVFSHVSSIISKDVLLFLKLYDGYPEPFSFSVRPLLFKFSREIMYNNANYSFVPFSPSGCTFQFMASMCSYAVIDFFSNQCFQDEQHKASFEKNNWHLEHWIIGNADIPGGWQCNLCCKDNCIQSSVKMQKWLFKSASASLLLSAKNANASVMEHILQNLTNKNLSFKIIPTSDPSFGPDIMFDNSEKYLYLLN